MGNLESNLTNLSETFDKLNEIRESSLTISRSIVRDCSKSIRYLHRNDTQGAKEFIKNAEKKIKELKKLTSKVSEISFAGYVLDAEREYVEAVIFYVYEMNGIIEPFEKFDVHPSSYIQGIGDAIGEWRRKALDNLKNLELNNAESYLNIMEDGLGILNQLDYPDALTGGLRRYADNARGIIERTRSDVTNAFVNDALRDDISKIKRDEL